MELTSQAFDQRDEVVEHVVHARVIEIGRIDGPGRAIDGGQLWSDKAPKPPAG